VTTIEEVVRERNVVICCGSGGVGKTTTAAVIALEGARHGRNACVVTIDPARRLANALGLDALADHPSEIDRSRWDGIGGTGRLSALMLDTKSTFDQLVTKNAGTPEQAQRILDNTFYRNISSALGGTQEYMAMEKLHELHDAGGFDLIVVDTPPTRHALDFLEAPKRIDDFLDRRVVRWFVRPYAAVGWSALRAVNRTASFILRRIEQATGVSALAEISDFFTSMSGLLENFHSRVERAYEVLRGAETAFVLVSGTEEEVLGDAEYLSTKMAELRMPLKGVVVNRVHREYRPRGRGRGGRGEPGPEDVEAVRRLVEPLVGDADAAARLAENFVDYQRLAFGECLRLEMFRTGLPKDIPVVRVPNFPRDVHDLAGLAAMHPHLFGAGQP